MNLANKKILASKVLKVGKNRVKFDSERLSEIKAAITKQDIIDLHKDGFIEIKPIKGRKKIRRRKTRRGPGKIKKKIKNRKQTYVKITRKLRRYLKELKNQEKITKELYWGLRKKIRMRTFKSKANLKEYLETIEKVDLQSKTENKNKSKKKDKPQEKEEASVKTKKTKTKKKVK